MEVIGPLRPDESRADVEIRIKKKVLAKLGGQKSNLKFN